uniref:Phospholipase A(2) n=1 Tax=Meloidogyne javanica TaxID=6303 RepID=A0A915MBF3_MELJA
MTNILHSAPVANEEKGAIKSPRSEIVAYEHWHCGSDDFDKSLSHQMAREQCPKRMFEADLCCVVHDACYMDETRNRQICDEQFCHCLERTVARSQNSNGNNKTVEIKENGCLDVSSTFCHIVNIFGGVAYASSVDLVNKQKAAMEVWEKQEAEKKKKAKELIEAEKKNKSKNVGDEAKNKGDNKEANKDEKSAVIHKFPLKDCSDKSKGLVDCSVQLQSCTNNLQNKKLEEGNIEANGNSFALLLSAKLAECTNQFCKCSSTKLLTKIEQNDKECDKDCFMSTTLNGRFSIQNHQRVII